MATIKGLDRLKDRLKRSGMKLSDVVEESLFKAGDDVVALAKLMVPRDTGHLGNTIQRSGMMKTKKGNPMVEVSAGDNSTLVGTRRKFQLARIKELGAVNHPAEPFLRPAMKRQSRQFRTGIRKAMRAVIKTANGTNTSGG